MVWNTGSIAIMALAAVGCMAALAAFLRTPAAQRWRVTTAARERDLARRAQRVQRGELVEIAAQPRRFWARFGIVVLAFAPVLPLVAARAMKVDLSCTRVAGWNLGVLLIAWFVWIAPLVVAGVCLAAGHMGWRGWASGCFPPVDAVLPARAWGDRTWRGRLRAALAMVLPVLGLAIAVLTVQLHGMLLGGRSLAQLGAAIERGCPSQ